MSVISISVSDQIEEKVRQLVKTGIHNNISEAYRAAMQKYLATVEYSEYVQTAIQKGLVDLESGRVSTKSVLQVAAKAKRESKLTA